MKYKNELGQPVGFPVKEWREADFPPKTNMAGRYCEIVPLDVDAHAESLFNSFAKDTENKNWTYLPYGPFESFSSFKSWLSTLTDSNDPFFYSIINLKDNAVVGLASYLRITPPQGVIEVGHIHFSPLLQRTPMATEAMYLMMQRVFDELGYRRYEWKCDSLNEPSRRAALRLGFTFEGIFRQALMYKGRNRDTAWYSIIDTEWPRLKKAFELWLAPSNFDSLGHQKNSLRDFITHISF
jgi:RimJ/RimL family protein N-acetyltransferase